MVDQSWGTKTVVAPTTGDAQSIPYQFLVGSDVGLESPQISAGKEALWATLDGVTGTLPATPANFANPTADEFLTWHSAHQNQYIIQHGSGGIATITNGGTLTAVRSTNGRDVYVVENLNKNDFAFMPKADQEIIAGTTAFRTTLASRLTLLPNNASATNTVGEARTLVKGIVTAAITQMNNNRGNMSAADVDAFTDQLDNLNLRLDDMAVFSKTDIEEKVDDIKARYDRANAFKNYPAQGSATNFKSTDDDATIIAGYAKFIEQEKRIRDLDNAKFDISRTGAVQDKSLDVPNLVFLFQLYANLQTEAIVSSETEEIQQQNKFLQDYSAMQAIINRTLKVFDDTGDDAAKEKHRILDKADEGVVSEPDLSVIRIFEEDNNGTHPSHPIEILRGLPRRPDGEFLRGTGSDSNKASNTNWLKTQWDAFATELSDSVSLINQETQIKMNEINSMDKQKNRNFDLANNALRKMTDMIQTISRTTS